MWAYEKIKDVIFYASTMSNRFSNNDTLNSINFNLQELAQLTVTSSHYSASRSRADQNRSSTPNNVAKANKNHSKNSGSSSNEKHKSNSSTVSSPMRTKSPEICQPGNTLLWDLLQDDKIVSQVELTATHSLFSTIFFYNFRSYSFDRAFSAKHLPMRLRRH